MMRLLYLLILILTTGTSFSQINCDKYSDKYAPKNLDDALNYLNCTWPEKDKQEFKSKDEETATVELHMGTGIGIRNNWGLWKGKNSLYRYFKSKGITHPDDISSIILTSFHRKLNNKEIDLNGQIKYYKDYWKEFFEQKEIEDRTLNEKLKNEFENYQKGDTVKIEFKVYTNQKNPIIYPIQGYPDLDQESNCFVIAVISGKRKRKQADYTLKIIPIDICGYQEIYWSSIHEKHGNFEIGREYNFFSLKHYKISKK